jgi:hypothetical protein
MRRYEIVVITKRGSRYTIRTTFATWHDARVAAALIRKDNERGVVHAAVREVRL